jgi:NTP pyrophosphatase (non-canonical NTP hydrolase)
MNEFDDDVEAQIKKKGYWIGPTTYCFYPTTPEGKYHERNSMQEHARMVALLVKPGDQIKEEMTAHDAHILHMAVGIIGEAGELIDAIKKKVIYQKPLDMLNVIEELGDIEFYLEGLRTALALNRDETLDANISKLAKRYGEKFQYTNQAAQERKDKV